MSTPNTPIEDSKVKDLKVFQAATNALTRAGIDKETLGRFQANWERQLLAWRDKAVVEAQSRHITDLARAVGILQGLGHPDVLLERHYNEAVARLTTPTKEREETQL